MPSHKATPQDPIQRMLYTGQALRRIIILIMDVQVILGQRVLRLGRKQKIIDKWFGRLTGEFNHHARWRIRVHVRILARHLVGLDIDDL